ASMVVEIASNDGYLLQYFHERQIPVLGIEPAANVARVALQHGIPTLVEFFGTEVADQLVKESAADLLIGNNVLAHVPDLNDFVRGMRRLLKPSGVITMEFPHLQHLVDGGHFDTIYHEHFSYFSWSTAARVFAAHGMELFDVEELPTHGGSIRIFGHHADDTTHAVTDRAREMSDREAAAGYGDLALYESFDASVRAQKRDIMRLFIEAKERGDRIAGYGAPAKGNTLLNYCGIGSDFIDFTVDINPNKQDFYLPGTHIPVLAPEEIRRQRPDVVFILPWNLTDEIVAEHGYVREWGGEFAARWPAVARF
ncbi:MAG: hypothetical protein QOF76_4794, partial [Solirubrobacteraceae bacterium]|nr:hypothetical protein [Solirubrobacteraceae bacterium]